MPVSTTVVLIFASFLIGFSSEGDKFGSIVRTDEKNATSEPSDAEISKGVKDKNVDGSDTKSGDDDNSQKGLDTADKNAIEVMFGVSMLSLVFFILLYICPPLCRQETKALHRRYIDTQLQIGEL